MDAKLIEKMWAAQKADPDHEDVIDFIGGMYKFFVPSRKWHKVSKAYGRIANMKYTKKDIILYIRFYLEAKNVYLGVKDAWEAVKEGRRK